MSVVMSMRWAGLTPEHYDQVLSTVRWEEDLPDGVQLHVAWFEAGDFRVTDVWDDQAGFERFLADRLAPAIQEAGITGQPDVTFSPLHRRFVVPGVEGAGS